VVVTAESLIGYRFSHWAGTGCSGTASGTTTGTALTLHPTARTTCVASYVSRHSAA
jgi:hypothetical protein